jgi:hypothetical protein
MILKWPLANMLLRQGTYWWFKPGRTNLMFTKRAQAEANPAAAAVPKLFGLNAL